MCNSVNSIVHEPMIWIEYEEQKRKYHEAQRRYDELLSEKSVILVTKGYHRQLKAINRRIAEIQQLLIERERLMNLKFNDLAKSRDPVDLVYYYRYIERLKVKKISQKVHYSDTQVYRILNTINETLNAKNGRK